MAKKRTVSTKRDTNACLPNHDDVFKQLISGPLSSNLTEFVFPRSKKEGRIIFGQGGYEIKEYLSKERQEKLNKLFIEHDMILTLSSCGPNKNNILKEDYRTVSIEIKTRQNNMENAFRYESDSFEKYMFATDFFFIAVPRPLLPKLIKLHRSHPKRKYVGIIDASNSAVVVKPIHQNGYDWKRRTDLLAHCHTSVNKFDSKFDSRIFSPKRVTDISQKTEFVKHEDLVINKEYLRYFSV